MQQELSFYVTLQGTLKIACDAMKQYILSQCNRNELVLYALQLQVHSLYVMCCLFTAQKYELDLVCSAMLCYVFILKRD